MLSLIHYIKPPDLLFRMCFMGAVRCFKRWLGQSKEPQENQASSSLNLPAEILETIWFTSASYCLCAHCQSLWCLLVPHNQTPGSASSQISIWHKYFLAASPWIFTSWISTPTHIILLLHERRATTTAYLQSELSAHLSALQEKTPSKNHYNSLVPLVLTSWLSQLYPDLTTQGK